MREFVFSGSALEASITLITDAFNTNIENITVKEIRVGGTVLSELPDLGSKTQTEVALLSEFLRLENTTLNLKEFAAIHGLTLTTGDQNTSSVVVTNVLSALNVDAVAFQSGNTIRYTFSATPDLSSVVVNNTLSVSGSTNSINDGLFYITTINDGSDYVDVLNFNRDSSTGNETSSPATGIISSF
jgi:hypothetical protein